MKTGRMKSSVTLDRFARSTRALLAVGGVVLLATGCASSGSRKQAEAKPKRTVLLTSADDVRAGADAARDVAADVGLLEDPPLVAYVEKIGRKLLRGLPRREFAYHFAIVDEMEPNAFALPGGYIYISRGLLALVNDEDELACVVGTRSCTWRTATPHSSKRSRVNRARSRSRTHGRRRSRPTAATWSGRPTRWVSGCVALRAMTRWRWRPSCAGSISASGC